MSSCGARWRCCKAAAAWGRAWLAWACPMGQGAPAGGPCWAWMPAWGAARAPSQATGAGLVPPALTHAPSFGTCHLPFATHPPPTHPQARPGAAAAARPLAAVLCADGPWQRRRRLCIRHPCQPARAAAPDAHQRRRRRRRRAPPERRHGRRRHGPGPGWRRHGHAGCQHGRAPVGAERQAGQLGAGLPAAGWLGT